MCGAGGGGGEGSDATAHIACISSSQLKKQASELISVSAGNPERRQNSKWKDSPRLSFNGFDNMTDKCAYVSARGSAGLP